MGSTNCLGEKGLRVMTTQCDTCIFLPGNRMHLDPGRVAEMAAKVKATDGYVTCHKTLDRPLRQRAVCRVSFDRFKTQIIQLAERLGHIEPVDPAEFTEADG